MSTIENQIKTLLDDVLHLQGKTASWTKDTPLLGNLPELDSLAVVEVIAGMEKTFGFHIEDDEINAEMMTSLASLTHFVEEKIDSLS